MSPDALPAVGPEELDAIAELCRRAVATPLSPGELEKSLFAPDQPAVVRFDPDVGLVATVRQGDEGWIRLLAVHPARRGRGHGHALVDQAEADLDGATTITVGADPPYFLFPGVPTGETACSVLLERHHYGREETNFNMDVDLDALPDGPGQADEPDPGERDAVDAFMAAHWPNWRPEVMRAFDQGGLWLSRDEAGIAGVCACNVNRADTLGPVAARPDLIGTGTNRPLLLGTLRALRDRGHRRIEVLWVGPIVPYARAGGRVGAHFFVYRKRR
jgi:predicted N-acetyltransferase YhbS